MSTQQSELAFERIRRDILNCELIPGSAVSEIGIAKRYDTGRASARTAMQRLAHQGLISVVPRRGYVITSVTIRDVREVFQMRLAVEPMAARLAAGRIDAKTMRQRERDWLKNWRGQQGAGSDVLAHNRYIHMHIAEATGNARLTRQIDDLLGESERSTLIGLKRGTFVLQMFGEHLPLIDALEAGDADLSEHLARVHVDTAMRHSMDALVNRDAVLSQTIHDSAS